MLESQRLLKKSPSLAKVIIVVFIVVFSLVTILAFVPWQQTAASYGYVTTLSPSERQQNISAPMGGRLGRWFVFEGEKVKKGDPIVEVIDLDPEVLSRLEEEKKAIELSIASSELAIKNAKKNVARHKHLVKTGASTQRIIEQSEFELVNYTKELAIQRVNLAKVKVSIARQKSRLVKAPVDGVIVDRVHGVGGLIVKETDVLATIVPESKTRIVELWVKNMDIPLIKLRDKVMLQFEGWPAVQFSGWPQIAIGTFEGEVMFISPQNNYLGEYKIFVKPAGDRNWPSPDILRLGTGVKAWVMLNKVSLGYELWRRYNGFPINLNSPDLRIEETKEVV
ncbi:HlyD family secretion protein [Francisella frigiditurris]|uniref:HlyD secretion family protein n=1 Tax=Francisella frigiditurris TaxID=1542390 RepID=A0A1J0KTJ0_9GAMM|nr:HlyD family efflux transporter periplasmic adaptor subunit [Francisella frigiditurris]APC97096.1 hlyD secretion family protein [Francisella frigiditurris]